MEMNHDIIVADVNYDLSSDTNEAFFCSLPSDTPENKKAIYNMLQSPTARVDDVIGKTLNIVHVLQHSVSIPDELTGEVTRAPRIVLLDDEGKSYVAVSTGVYTAIRNMIQVFGNPPWAGGIKIEPFKMDVKRGKATSLRMV